MLRYSRNLVLDIFDYNQHKLCTLFDNTMDVSGQAYDVFVTTERNGWKELSFEMPCVADTEEGQTKNFRLDYLKADYKIRLIDDDGTDWFIISEQKIAHNNWAKTVSVTAGHVSQLLKLKNLGLEFSDDEGNNVGTAAQLLATILDGTGWSSGTVDTFYEDDGSTVKVRSLTASTKTGAFKLITSMCDLFDAKPVFHGDTKKVDIMPMNPFSEPENGGLPDVTKADGVLELAYGQNTDGISRSLNTENIVTKLYAYGSYGDKTTGYCGIDECTHKEFVFTASQSYAANTNLYFAVIYNGDTIKRNFTNTVAISTGDKIIWSVLDPASKMYVCHEYTNEDDEDVKIAYFVSDGQGQAELINATSGTKEETNWFTFVMDFKYYKDIGLFSDAQLQQLMSYQRDGGAYHTTIYEKTLTMQDSLTELSETIGSVNFCKLAIVTPVSSQDGYIKLVLDKSGTHPAGVIYRTDYTENEKNYFKWIETEQLKTNGDPMNSGASMVFVVHDTTPVTWDKAYVKKVDDVDNPSYVVLHAADGTISFNASTDNVFLFESNNINGYLGAREAADEACEQTLTEALKVVTEEHPVYFSTIQPSIDNTKLNGYGWWWKYYTTIPSGSSWYPHELYFCDYDSGDRQWYKVYYSNETPNVGIDDGEYWYDWDTSKLYKYDEDDGWVYTELGINGKISIKTATVYLKGMYRDQYYHGLYANYKYTLTESLSGGNYYFETPYETFVAFSTTDTLSIDDTLTWDTHDGWIEQDHYVDGSAITTQLELDNYRFDNVRYHVANAYKLKAEEGTIDDSNETEDSSGYCRTDGYISVLPSNTYSFFNSSYTLNVYFYDYNKKLKSSTLNVNGNGGTVTTATGIYYIRVCAHCTYSVFNAFNFIVRSSLYNTGTIVIDEKNYTKLTPTVGSGDIRGIVPLIKKFSDLADDAYLDNYNDLIAAQNNLKTLETTIQNNLGDMYREGYWEKNDYVDGDEDKLYSDAVDNIEEVAKPEATYNINYLDLYGTDTDTDMAAEDELFKAKYPDISILSAIHLIDPEIDVNIWAYADKIQKCYDKPWETKLSIDTNLSSISQHSFTDVMSNIANVASELNGKITKYDSTSATVAGTAANIATEALEGSINAKKLKINGASSNWYTDDDGNMVFENADGSSAMKLTGSGFAIANSKDEWGNWNWRLAGTGEGFSADVINTGTLTAKVIETGSITTDKLSSSVGNELDISSNKAINMIVEDAAGKAEQSITGESIIQKVSSQKAWTDLNDSVANNTSSISTANSAISNLNTDYTELQTKVEDYNSTITQKYDSISASVTNMEGITSWMSLTDSGLQIGKTDSTFSTLLTNQGLYFKQDQTNVAYVQNNKLYIPVANITSQLQLGRLYLEDTNPDSDTDGAYIIR